MNCLANTLLARSRRRLGWGRRPRPPCASRRRGRRERQLGADDVRAMPSRGKLASWCLLGADGQRSATPAMPGSRRAVEIVPQRALPSLQQSACSRPPLPRRGPHGRWSYNGWKIAAVPTAGEKPPYVRDPRGHDRRLRSICGRAVGGLRPRSPLRTALALTLRGGDRHDVEDASTSRRERSCTGAARPWSTALARGARAVTRACSDVAGVEVGKTESWRGQRTGPGLSPPRRHSAAPCSSPSRRKRSRGGEIGEPRAHSRRAGAGAALGRKESSATAELFASSTRHSRRRLRCRPELGVVGDDGAAL